MAETKERCCKTRMRWGKPTWQCSRKAVVVRGNLPYCKQHDPVLVDLRYDARMVMRRAEADASDKSRARAARLSAAKDAVWELAKGLVAFVDRVESGPPLAQIASIIGRMKAELDKAGL